MSAVSPASGGVAAIPATPDRASATRSTVGERATAVGSYMRRNGSNSKCPRVTIDGLPAGVRVEGTNLAANAAEAVVKFATTEKTEPVTGAKLTVRGAAIFNDRIYRHSAGGITLTISPPAAIEVAATNAVVVPKQP